LRAAISHGIEALLHESDECSFGNTITLLQAVSSCLRLTLTKVYPAQSHVLEYDFDMPNHVRILFPSTYRERGAVSPYLDNLRLYSLSQVQSITMGGMTSDDIDSFVGLFRALPNITEISFDDCSCDEDLIRALTDQSWGYRVEDISPSRSDIESETILCFAQSRAIDPRHPDRSSLTPLRRLSFKECVNISDVTLRDLKELVPEVV